MVKSLVRAFMLCLISMNIRTVKAQQQPGYSIVLGRTAFETTVAYPRPESFITATVKCNFDDWSMKVSWGDGNVESLTHSAVASLPGPATPAGTYPLYSSHAYSKAAPTPYTATAELWVHCVGGPAGHGSLVDKEDYKTVVFDRLPLNTLTPSSNSVKRGAKLDLKVETFADAPASGTRVDITDNKAGVFGNGALLVHADIPATSKTVSTTLTVSKTAPLGPVTLTATAGSQVTKVVQITP